MSLNKRVIFKKIPTGIPSEEEHFEIKEEKIDLDTIPLPKGHILVKNLYASVDPYMRGRMRDPKIRSYVPAFKTNSVLETLTISEVIRSEDLKFPKGTLVSTMSGCENYSVIKARACKKIQKEPTFPLTYYLSLLGLPGLTAYIGLYKIGQPKPGETIFVSGASGAVGQIVGQLAKIRGLRVIGSAGTDEKVEYLKNELNFDGAFNYKKTKNIITTLKVLCPKGIDIYFDNVGGPTLDAALALCNDFARIPLCGMISQYNSGPGEQFPIKNLIVAVPRRIHLEGFIATDKHPELEKNFIRDVTQLIIEKKLKISESVSHGVEKIPKSLIEMFAGKNNGKQLVSLTSKL